MNLRRFLGSAKKRRSHTSGMSAGISRRPPLHPALEHGEESIRSALTMTAVDPSGPEAGLLHVPCDAVSVHAFDPHRDLGLHEPEWRAVSAHAFDSRVTRRPLGSHRLIRGSRSGLRTRRHPLGPHRPLQTASVSLLLPLHRCGIRPPDPAARLRFHCEDPGSTGVSRHVV